MQVITIQKSSDKKFINKGSMLMSTNRHSIREASLRPQWLDEQLNPFQSRFVEVEGHR
jgi:hypothetical protein